MLTLGGVACADDPLEPPANQAPRVTAAIPSQTVSVGEMAAIDMSAHFTDPNGDALLFAAEISDEAVATVALSGSTLTVSAVAQGAAEVTVTARDPGGLTASHDFLVTVPNRPPVAVDSIPGFPVFKGDSATIDVSAHFTDPDGDTLLFAAESSDETVATVALSGSTLTVSGGAQGSAEVTVTARDPGELTASHDFLVTVPNQPPVAVDSIPGFPVFKGDSATIDMSAHFTDPDGDTLLLAAEISDETVVTVALSGSTLTVSAAGQGAAEVTVTARDPGGLTASQDFLVTVPNRAPAAVDSILGFPVFKGDSVTIDMSAHFADPDGDTLLLAAGSSDETVATVALSGSTLTVSAAGQGAAEVTVTARDPGGLTASQDFLVAVPNRPPVAVDSIPGFSAFKGDSATIDVSAHFTDPDGDALLFAAESSDETVATVALSGSTLTVSAVAQGAAEVTVTAWDPGGLTASQDFGFAVWSDRTRRALVALYESTGGPNWFDNDNWLTNKPIGSWYGVEVDAAGHVTGLELRGNNLEGQSPPELGDLDGLMKLSLRNNELTGHLPPELGNLINLLDVDLGDNRLTGPILPELGGLTKLGRLLLHRNELTGTIPPELGRLANLEDLWLSSNDLRGVIPPELGSLSELKRLLLLDSNLTGTIPPELGNLANLEEMKIQKNNLTGHIPSEFGQLDNLIQLFISDNNLTGSLPRSLLKVDLRVLDLAGNAGLCVPGVEGFVIWLQRQNLDKQAYCNEADVAGLEALYGATGGADWRNSSGWLDGVVLDRWYGVSIDSLGRVASLDLSRNRLAGTLPYTLGQSLATMVQLRIDGNSLTGPLPWSLVTLPLRELHYSDTDLCVPSEASYQTWLRAIPSHQGTGVECPPLSDRDILVALFEATNGSDWRVSNNWNTEAPLDTWYGVEVDDRGRVVSLRLRGNQLTGAFPLELTSLTALQDLRLDGNSLTGSIPSELGRLATLITLDLARNLLAGSIPPELGHLTNLTHLNLASNQLTGSIPPELGSLVNLESLNLRWNSLAGRIPPELGALLKLKSLELGGHLSGPIPPELGSLAQLQSLDLQYNHLSGPIPPELGSLAQLRYLHLLDNDLTGPIPPELGALAQLQSLDLQDNNLTGPIPPELGRLANVTRLDLSFNRLTGRIPLEVGTLANLQFLDFSNNNLTGNIPSELGYLGRLEWLELERNGLTGSIPPELGSLARLRLLHLRNNALAGPIPTEFGNLINLTSLDLSSNGALSGPLPGSLTNLRQLHTLLTHATNLCAQSDRELQDWLVTIRRQRVGRCEEAGAMVYLSQAIQSREFPVPLVAGEEALLRVFVTAARTTAARMPPVRAHLYLHGSEPHVVEIPGQQSAIPTQVGESSLSRSANARIPGRMIQPGLEIVIEVDPQGVLDPSLGVKKRFPETGRLPVDVHAMPVLDLTLIPFVRREYPDSTIIDIVTAIALDPLGHALLAETRTLLPVAGLDVTAHASVSTTSGNLWGLFRETEAIQVLEGSRGYYMGMVSGPRDGPSGLASGRTSVSFPIAQTMAHELGHNMSLGHAPCGGAGGPDPSYPWSGGRIGAWGFDFREGGRLVDPSARDLMSYCGPQWISDYHFATALRHRLLDEFEAAALSTPTRSLLLWGGVNADGVPLLEPAFVVDAVPSVPNRGGEYRLEGIAADGSSLFYLNFDMPEVADSGGAGAFAFLLPVGPEWSDSLASISLSGPNGSVTLDGESDHFAAILLDRRSGQIRGILRDLPVSARFQADMAAHFPSIPRLEVLFSRGIPDAAEWFR